MKTDKFWKDKKVLILGHTGFKGSWLTIWLKELGANIVGYGLESKLEESNYILCNLSEKIVEVKADINDKEQLKKVFEENEPEIVINLVNSKEAIDVYETNIIGTKNVLECIKNTDSVKVAIMAISDKCYRIKEQMWGYREEDSLEGVSPYGASMASAALIIDSFRKKYLNPIDILSHNKSIASVRIGRVIGGGLWGEKRLIPECAKAFSNNDSVVIRNPESICVWQHVLEPIRGILILAQKMYENPGCYCENWNLGGEYENCTTVVDGVSKFRKEFKRGEILELDEEDIDGRKGTVVLDITKAKYRLGWTPKWTIDKTIHYTADWYKNYKNKNVYNICRNHIEKYSLL